MIVVDEDALECDLAETYNIYDYRELPPMRVALFAMGLSNDSRIKRAMSGMQVSLNTYLLASITDYLSWLVWSKTKDAQKGKNKPQSVVDLINGKEATEEEIKENIQFQTAEDFEALWNQIANSEEEKGG